MDIDLSALRMLESEKDISMETSVKAIEDALLVAYHRTEGAAQTARVQIGVGVDGMVHTTVSGNTMNVTHISGGRCPHVDYAAEISAGYASGSFSPQPDDVNFDGCV